MTVIGGRYPEGEGGKCPVTGVDSVMSDGAANASCEVLETLDAAASDRVSERSV